MEMVVSLFVMIIIVIIAAVAQARYIRTAQRITLEHDLRAFAEIQSAEFNSTGRFAGRKGQTITHDMSAADFRLFGFRPSRDVTITVVSGGPLDPFNPQRSCIVQARHRKLKTVLEYNLTTNQLVEK